MSEEFVRTIRTYVHRRFPLVAQSGHGDDASLLESGLIDSLGILDVATFLNQEFGIELADDELSPENFDSISALAHFIERRTR